MSESEAIEAVSLLLDNAIASFTACFSFTFAYLTASYLVGAQLSNFQAKAVSILYVVAAASPAVSVVGCQFAMAKIQNEYPSAVIDDLLMWDMRIWHIYVATLFVSVILLSLYFMYDCRRPKS